MPLDDICIIRGYGCFDFLRAYNGKPFLFKDHYKRFKNSAKVLDLKVPLDEKKVHDIIIKLLKKNGLKNAHIRMVITGGQSPDAITSVKPNFYILMDKLIDLPQNLFEKGAKLITHDYKRLFPEAKTTTYMSAVRLQKEKKKKGAIEILYTNGGKIYEASTSNIFIIKKGKIYTPKNGVLNGITRKTTIKIAKTHKVIEKDISVKELFAADEVFLTATNKKVLPIVEIDGKKISNGKPGEITKELLSNLEEYIKENSK